MDTPKLPKMGGNKSFQYLFGGAFLLVIFYLIFRPKVDSAIITASGYEFDTAPDKLDGNKILRNGSRGAEVAALQSDLVGDGATLGTYGPAGDGVDGVFGPKTESALMAIKGVTAISLNAYATAPNRSNASNMGGRDQLFGNLAGDVAIATSENTGIAGNLTYDA